MLRWSPVFVWSILTAHFVHFHLPVVSIGSTNSFYTLSMEEVTWYLFGLHEFFYVEICIRNCWERENKFWKKRTNSIWKINLGITIYPLWSYLISNILFMWYHDIECREIYIFIFHTIIRSKWGFWYIVYGYNDYFNQNVIDIFF